jgi:hypothetical protein
LITESKFDSNSAGYRGTAVTINLCTDVDINDNEFIKNGPTLSTLELSLETPYHHFLQAGERTSVYFDPNNTCENEFVYVEECLIEDYSILIAHSEGAIYISADTSEDSDTRASTLIYDNFFFNNQAAPILN